MAQALKVARLDLDQVYFGLDEKTLADVVAGDVVFGDAAIAARLPAGAVYAGADCDLPGGRYKWDGKTFQPLPASQQKLAETAPDHERALYELCTRLHGDGTVLPRATLLWCLAYERSFDAAAAPGVDTAAIVPLTFFRDATKGAA